MQAGSPRGVREAVREQRQAPHSNVIVDMHVFKAPDGTPGKFTTAGWDGRVLVWQVDLTETIKAIHSGPVHACEMTAAPVSEEVL